MSNSLFVFCFYLFLDKINLRNWKYKLVKVNIVLRFKIFNKSKIKNKNHLKTIEKIKTKTKGAVLTNRLKIFWFSPNLNFTIL